MSDGLCERNSTGLSWNFVFLLPSPDFSIFPVSPSDIVTWLKSGLNTLKGC